MFNRINDGVQILMKQFKEWINRDNNKFTFVAGFCLLGMAVTFGEGTAEFATFSAIFVFCVIRKMLNI